MVVILSRPQCFNKHDPTRTWNLDPLLHLRMSPCHDLVHRCYLVHQAGMFRFLWWVQMAELESQLRLTMTHYLWQNVPKPARLRIFTLKTHSPFSIWRPSFQVYGFLIIEIRRSWDGPLAEVWFTLDQWVNLYKYRYSTSDHYLHKLTHTNENIYIEYIVKSLIHVTPNPKT